MLCPLTATLTPSTTWPIAASFHGCARETSEVPRKMRSTVMFACGPRRLRFGEISPTSTPCQVCQHAGNVPWSSRWLCPNPLGATCPEWPQLLADALRRLEITRCTDATPVQSRNGHRRAMLVVDTEEKGCSVIGKAITHCSDWAYGKLFVTWFITATRPTHAKELNLRNRGCTTQTEAPLGSAELVDKSHLPNRLEL